MAGLLEAVVAVAEDLSLDAVLERVVQSACRLLHGPLRRLGRDRRRPRPEHFITVGIDGELARQSAPCPPGHGVLGLLISDPRPLPCTICAASGGSGSRRTHPAMQSFLGVPVRVRDTCAAPVPDREGRRRGLH